MRVAYFDCHSGISGDMFVASLLDAGLSFERLEEKLKKLNISGFSIDMKKVTKGSLTAVKFNVVDKTKQKARNINDIRKIIEGSDLEDELINKAVEIFRTIAEAEAKIHGEEIEDIHFHEVGAIDSIVDILSSVIGLKELGIEKCFSSCVHLGSGFTKCQHGLIPLPAPATIEILKGVPVFSNNIKFEMTTPTGAALLKNCVEKFDYFPNIVLDRIGYGAGSRELTFPNVLRVMIGEMKQEYYESDKVTNIKTNIDDMNPQIYSSLMDDLFSLGALDVYIKPVMMKKNRPGVELTVISSNDKTEKILDKLFRSTTTFGVRLQELGRKKLKRDIIEVKTEYGHVNVKLGYIGKKIIKFLPEYEDCLRLSKEFNIPVTEIMQKIKFIVSNKIKKGEI